jgi:hypothetical protein
MVFISKKKGRPIGRPKLFVQKLRELNSLNVFSLQSLGSLGHVELDALAFLKALEAARLDGRKVHEDIFAIFAADESKSLSIVEPLNCSLFHCVDFPFSINCYAEGIGEKLWQGLAVEGERLHLPVLT